MPRREVERASQQQGQKEDRINLELQKWGGVLSSGSVALGVPPRLAELVQQGADTPFMQQVERGHVPTVAASPQGSLIVILKDSTKSTWQFTRTHAFTEPGLQRAPRTRTGVHTHAEKRPPGGPTTCTR